MKDALAPRAVYAARLGWAVAGAALIAFAAIPGLGLGNYPLHIVITALITAYTYTSWSIMGRLGLVSFGHSAFLGVGAYGAVLCWNLLGWSPWIGGALGIVVALALAAVIGWPCFQFRIVGNYFAMVTLALCEIVRLIIVAAREYTGGSLGITPNAVGTGNAASSLFALQFADRVVWFYIALAFWLAGLAVWHLVDRSMARLALDAVSEEEEAAASIGVDVSWLKLGITLLSAGMTAAGGVVYAQYNQYINPETVLGLSLSLQIVFGSIAGGLFVMLGPTLGAVFLLLLSESLRIAVGTELRGLDSVIYGVTLILFIIYMPRGILGEALHRVRRR